MQNVGLLCCTRGKTREFCFFLTVNEESKGIAASFVKYYTYINVHPKLVIYR